MNEYRRAERAHAIAEELGIPFGAAFRVATCIGKVSFRCREDAERAAEEWRHRCPQEPYRCPICGRWHLTSEGGRSAQQGAPEGE